MVKMVNLKVSINTFFEFINFFYSGGKKLFWFLWGALVCSLILLCVTLYSPTAWVSEVKPLAESGAETIILQTAQENYREIDLYSKAYSNFIQFSSSHFSPSSFLLYLWLFFQIIGWSALLAGGSRLEGILSYIPLLGVCSFLYLSEFASVFVLDFSYHKVAAFLIILPFLVFYYLIKIRTLTLNLTQQWAVYAIAFFLLFLATGLVGGMPELYKTATYAYRLHLIVIAVFILFVAKDIPALLTWLFIRNPQAAGKKQYIGWAAALLVFFLFNALLFFLPEYRNIEPLHFFVLSTFITVFLSQNIFRAIGGGLNSQFALSLLILGAGLLATGAIAFYTGNGELTFLKNIQLLVNFVFGVFGGLFTIYLIINWGPALRAGNYFWEELYIGKSFRFAPVWMITLTFWFIYDGVNLWQTYYALHCANQNIRGDYYLLAGDENEARLMYQIATNYAEFDLKANFNLANVLMGALQYPPTQEQVMKIQNHLKNAEKAGFPILSRLKQGRFFVLLGLNQAAKILYLSHIKSSPSPEFFCNLAGIYFNEGKLDSTEYYLKQSLTLNPDNAFVNANLASLLLKKGNIKQAINYSQKAYAQNKTEPVILENYFLFQLVNDSLPIAAVPFRKDPNISVGFQYNQSLLALKKGNAALADSIASWLIQRTEASEIKFLKLLTTAAADQWQKATDWYKSLTHQDPDYTPIASHALATLYYQRNTPEMAALYFKIAAQNGWPKDSLWYAYAELDAGNHYRAYDILKVLALDHKDLADLCRREMALLDFAYGNTEYIDWDFSDITPNEALRGGVIGAKVENPNPALKFYQPLVDKDSKITTPYLEIGRLYRQLNGEESALRQFALGLKRDPENIPLNLEAAQSEIGLNKLEEAQKRLQKIEKKARSYPEYLYVKALAELQKKRIPKAQNLLELNHKQFIWHKPTVIELAELYLKQKKFTEGFAFLGKYLDYNSQSPEIWLRYYLFASQIGMPEEAQSAKENMLQLLDNDKKRKIYLEKIDSLNAKYMRTM
jgi:predicted Zn-dependent protease